MNSADMISIHDLPNVSLDYVLEHCANDSWKDAQVANSRYVEYDGVVSLKDIRDSHTTNLDYDLQYLLKQEVDPLVQEYAKKMGIHITIGEGCYLVKYEVGQFFAEHVDKTEEFPRKISAVVYLNDDYEGGTITFTKLNKVFKPKANTLFLFPSSEEFKHSADPVTSGVKYCIVGFWS